MENETIARLIKIFETSTLTLVVLLAIAGIALLIIRARSGDAFTNAAADNASQKINKIKVFTQNTLIRAFCIAALVAFLPELTYFNYAYYLRYFAGEEIVTTSINTENQQLLRLTNGGVAELFVAETGRLSGVAGLRFNEQLNISGIGLRFNNINQVITSIHIDADQKYDQKIIAEVSWRDEEGTPYTFAKRLFRGLPHGYYIPLQPRGKVSELELAFVFGEGVGGVQISNVTLNKPIPFYLSGLRLLVLTFILFVIIAVANNETRAKLSYALFQYKFDATNKRQTWAYVTTVVLLLVLSWLYLYTGRSVKELQKPEHQQYNVYLVDALIAGRTYLDYGNPEKKLEWERPYDAHWRRANNKTDVMFDWAWYNGKYYSYFGVVPAIILHVPYKLITGEYLTNHASVFIFCATFVVILALLWRYCVIKWMPDARFAFFMLGFLTLYFASHVHVLLTYGRFYSIVQAAGLMFAITGIYLLLKSIDKEKINHALLFFACLSFALVAGCRPNLIFVSILIPIILWKHRSWKMVAFVALPFIMVAIPLMWYNYIRFDSVTEFGTTYMLTTFDMGIREQLLNPVGKFLATFGGVLQYLFTPASYSLEFPYVVSAGHRIPSGIVVHGISIYPHEIYGLINFPIILCLLYMFKKSFRKGIIQQTLPLLYGFLITAFIMIIAIAHVLSPYYRYLPDFWLFVILPSLFCAYGFCYKNNGEVTEKTHMKLVYLLMGIGITVGGFLSITGSANEVLHDPPRNQLLYQWLESVLSII